MRWPGAALVAAACFAVSACHRVPPQSVHPPASARQPAPARLGVPMLIAPADGAAFTTYPRVLEMHWAEIPDAASYGVEVDYHHEKGWNLDVNGTDFVVENLPAPAYTMDFVGNQPGRWRAWAIDRNGRRGDKSEWRMFTWDPTQKLPSVPAAGSDGSRVARPIYAPNPPYPDSARRSRTSGTVLVELTIGADGLVKSARVVRSLTEDLDNAALAAVKVWRFEPALKNGQPIATTATVVVSFNLK
jgi:TonB family protein